MKIKKLNLFNFRNFATKEIYFENKNLIVAKNGLGKTSVLEAINLVAVAKSFRSNNLNCLILNKEKNLNVKLILETQNNLEEEFLFSREKLNKTEGKNKIFYKDKKTSVAQVAKLIPLQIINQDDFLILEGSPSLRRKFLDWGVFHVKHNFYENWQNYYKILKNRNSLLKNKNIDFDVLKILDSQLIKLANEINTARKEYLKLFEQELVQKIKDWSFLKDIKIKYFCGWDEKKPFAEVLEKSLKKDIDFGSTSFGVHRCDLKFEIENKNALDFLSRGQQKIFVIMLKFSQGNFLKKEKQINCIYLIDDLYAELDKENFAKILKEFMQIDNQIIVTTKEKIEFLTQEINEVIL